MDGGWEEGVSTMFGGHRICQTLSCDDDEIGEEDGVGGAQEDGKESDVLDLLS